MNRRALPALVGAVSAGLLVLGSVGAVSAADPTAVPAADSARCARPAAAELSAADHGIGVLRRLGDCEIGRRLVLLDRLGSRVDGSANLTTAHRTALAGQIDATTSGLIALRTAIDHETDLTALKADLRKIVTDYRVYVLVSPKSNLVIAADTLQAGYTSFGVVEGRLADAIAAAKAAGKDTTKAQADYDAMIAKVDQAEALLAPVAGSIIDLTPADYNAGTARPVLQAAHNSLRQVRGLFAGARADARACRADLRALQG
jgi:hypothetical protein